jgi:beta-galactosidase
VQVENEYANVAKRYGEEGQRYLAWLAELVKSLGVDVPLIMCEGGAAGTVETVNGHSISAERVATFREKHPELPMIWTELWPAWYDTWGFQSHRRDPRNIARHLLDFIARGGCGWNYYMWQGGTNFGRTSMYLQATTYDFDAPLDEYGRITPKGAFLARLHRLLCEQEPVLLDGERQIQTDGKTVETIWRLDGRGLKMRVGPEGGRVWDGTGRLLFDTATAAVEISRSGWDTLELPWAWECQREPWPGEGPRRGDAVRSPDPVEQLSLTHDTTDYCWYSTMREVAEDGEVELEIPAGGDLLQIHLDGEVVARSQPPFTENRGATRPDLRGLPANDLESQAGDGYRQTFRFPATRGRHRLDILAAALGLAKGDWMLAAPMQTECKGIWRPVRINGRPQTGWEMRPGLWGERQPLAAWQPVAGTPRACTWYRATFRLRPEMLSADADFRLDAAGRGKGMLFINGHAAGRYWLVAGHGYGADQAWQDAEREGLSLAPAGEPTQRYYRIPRSWLQVSNELVLFEEQECSPLAVKLQVRGVHGIPSNNGPALPAHGAAG